MLTVSKRARHPAPAGLIELIGLACYYVEGPIVLQDVPQLGLLDIRHIGDRSAGTLPRKQGTPVKGGELFVEHRGGPTMTLLLIADTARASIVPHTQVAEDQLVYGASNLTVTWSTRP